MADAETFVRPVGEGDEEDWTDIGPVDLESVRVYFDSDGTEERADWAWPPAERSASKADEAKPAVTRRQYEQARAVLDALPAGLYLKCECGRWQRGGTMHFTMGGPQCNTCMGS